MRLHAEQSHRLEHGDRALDVHPEGADRRANRRRHADDRGAVHDLVGLWSLTQADDMRPFGDLARMPADVRPRIEQRPQPRASCQVGRDHVVTAVGQGFGHGIADEPVRTGDQNSRHSMPLVASQFHRQLSARAACRTPAPCAGSAAAPRRRWPAAGCWRRRARRAGTACRAAIACSSAPSKSSRAR